MAAHHFQEITCPDTGRQILVACRLDPVGKLYASNQISSTQHQAAIAYQADLEALAGHLRAASHGPSDLTWRGRRPGGNDKAAQRLKRAGAALTPDQLSTIQNALAGHRTDVRMLHQALNKLAVAYGFSTATRH
jgi:hypothetical protein